MSTTTDSFTGVTGSTSFNYGMPDMSIGNFKCLVEVETSALAASGTLHIAWTDRGGNSRSKSVFAVSLLSGVTMYLDVPYYTEEDTLNHDSQIAFSITVAGVLTGLSYRYWIINDYHQGV